ncbi:hypothetical protein PhCBS80983_g05066 [Powellomyces hirtus]|uniref:Trimethylguanosine synthase n=1 Tax=Powellomyces hirtus TaxID=109895 RepID=A0A507DW24_9FUNG|nr:hypothetical protein PhCBS80983_g05066 [Powellomyces hirtus]
MGTKRTRTAAELDTPAHKRAKPNDQTFAEHEEGSYTEQDAVSGAHASASSPFESAATPGSTATPGSARRKRARVRRRSRRGKRGVDGDAAANGDFAGDEANGVSVGMTTPGGNEGGSQQSEAEDGAGSMQALGEKSKSLQAAPAAGTPLPVGTLLEISREMLAVQEQAHALEAAKAAALASFAPTPVQQQTPTPQPQNQKAAQQQTPSRNGPKQGRKKNISAKKDAAQNGVVATSAPTALGPGLQASVPAPGPIPPTSLAAAFLAQLRQQEVNGGAADAVPAMGLQTPSPGKSGPNVNSSRNKKKKTKTAPPTMFTPQPHASIMAVNGSSSEATQTPITTHITPNAPTTPGTSYDTDADRSLMDIDYNESTANGADPEWYDDEYYIWTKEYIPKRLRKYWDQRYNLFSRFDEGVMLDEESWFSVTPERMAEHHAARMACDTIIDGFCGAGGNAIQFAKTCKKVIAIDIDPVKLRCARHNARLYGVEDKIEFILGDVIQVAPQYKADAIFLSPPWGGPKYLSAETYDFYAMMPIDGATLLEVAKKITPNICLYMPRNADTQQLIDLAPIPINPTHPACEIETQSLNGRVKAIAAYYGNLVAAPAAPDGAKDDEGTTPGDSSEGEISSSSSSSDESSEESSSSEEESSSAETSSADDSSEESSSSEEESSSAETSSADDTSEESSSEDSSSEQS